ncbi:hypothetical protein AB6T85_22490 [Erwinia sp. ACCC 02193]|uniref:Transcriptional regulator n=1 Tax=Erwinia aeris TaxID=3239803 RepID=A0ABV4EEI5_9GAMM
MSDEWPAGAERLSVQAFRTLVKDKGWMIKAVAARWQISDTWMSKLINDTRRGAQWDDACRGLPDLRCGVAAISAQELRTLKKEKGGWMTRTLAARWNMTEQTVGHIFRNSGRPLVWDDAFRGVPHISEDAPPLPAEAFRALTEKKSWPPGLLAARWGMSPEQLAETVSRPDRGSFWDDACRGLPGFI